MTDTLSDKLLTTRRSQVARMVCAGYKKVAGAET